MTTTGEETILKESTVQQFKATIRGALLRPGADGYDAARKVFNAMIDKRPALIARCTGVADAGQCGLLCPGSPWKRTGISSGDVRPAPPSTSSFRLV